MVIEKKSGGNIGIMEKMGTSTVYWGYTGVMYIGIMEKKMKTICPEHIWKLGQRCPRGSTEYPRLAESKGQCGYV